MPSVQLARLRSQINAVALHFQNGQKFKRSLLSLLELYSNPNASNRDWYKSQPSLTEMHVPHSVIAELDTLLEFLAKEQPENGLINVDMLWAIDRYETKHLAISLLSGLAKTRQEPAIERIRMWISPDLDQRLMREILEAFKNQSDILLTKQWVDSISNWLSSDDDEIRRIGLKAINKTIEMDYQNLPQIFSLLTPVMQNPRISIQKELVDVIKSLISRSEAETASFLITVGTIFNENEAKAFVRKCIPLFDAFFQKEIKSSLP